MYILESDCVLLHASCLDIQTIMERDPIFRDRLIVSNNAKKSRRDTSVALLHTIAKVSIYMIILISVCD